MADESVTRNFCYRFAQVLTSDEVDLLLRNRHGDEESRIAVLEIGCFRMDAVVLPECDRSDTCFDIYVKDPPDAKEWIFYQSIYEEIDHTRKDLDLVMLCRLLTFLNASGLSFRECRFPRKPGMKKPGSERR